MNRPRPNDSDFMRDCLGVDAVAAASPSAPEPRNPRFEERRRWATTALAAFGIAALAGALFAIAASCWDVWPLSAQTAFLIVATALAHGGGAFADRREEPLLAHFLYCLGAATFLVGTFALFSRTPEQQRDLWANALPPATLLVFATALTTRSRALHFLTTAAMVVAFAIADSSRLIFAFHFADWALVCCAFGACWAWRRNSVAVATIYFAVFLWTLFEIFTGPLPTGAHALTLICAAGLFQHWFGASFRSVIGSTVGVFVALVALGLTAFPYFWSVTFTTNVEPPFGVDVALSSTFQSALCAALFVIFSTRLIFDGARQNVVQFAIAVAVLAIWVIAQCVVAGVQLSTNRLALVPPAVAAIVFAVALVKSRLGRNAFLAATSSDASKRPAVVSDALDDDQDLDDLFDAEARAGSQTPRLSPVSESLDAFFNNLERRGRLPLHIASILAQALALVDFARSDWTFF